MRKIALLLIVLTSFQSVGMAETRVPIERQVSRTKARIEKIGVGEHHRIRVILQDDSQVTGYVAAIDNKSFAVMDKKAKTIRTIAYSDVASVKGNISKKQITILTIAGIAAGITAAVYAVKIDSGMRSMFSCEKWDWTGTHGNCVYQ